mmetsp:Transcript_37913/g.79406  ORF Transcript_37913/g.79406 Transcript_37913/m.79406 type:complete len:110 (+) Transcript_37913:103-432(+)
MHGIDEAKLRRLEKESERFTNDIEQKETENKLLREQIAAIKSQIEEGKKKYDEIAKGRKTITDQKLKMNEIMQRRKLSNCNESREKEIAELRKQLKQLRMKTFPRFNPV